MVELSDEALNVVFREARTFNAWTNQSVADETFEKSMSWRNGGPPAPIPVPPASCFSDPGRRRRD